MTDSLSNRIKSAIVARNEDLLQEEEYDARIYYEDIDGWADVIAAAIDPVASAPEGALGLIEAETDIRVEPGTADPVELAMVLLAGAALSAPEGSATAMHLRRALGWAGDAWMARTA